MSVPIMLTPRIPRINLMASLIEIPPVSGSATAGAIQDLKHLDPS
jgi:hypothetical protein